METQEGTHKQDVVYDFIKKKKEVSQPEIVDYFLNNKEWYKNKASARSNISTMLARLEKQNKITHRTIANEDRGRLYKNVWKCV